LFICYSFEDIEDLNFEIHLISIILNVTTLMYCSLDAPISQTYR